MTHRVRCFQPSLRSDGKQPRAWNDCERQRRIHECQRPRQTGRAHAGLPEEGRRERQPSVLNGKWLERPTFFIQKTSISLRPSSSVPVTACTSCPRTRPPESSLASGISFLPTAGSLLSSLPCNGPSPEKPGPHELPPR